MELRITKSQNGTPGLPSSIKRNVEVASYSHYEKMNIKSFKSMAEHRNHIATLREISKFREDGNEIVASIFAKSMDKVKVLTGVKNWIGLEGMKFFMDEVMDRYAKDDPLQIQLTPVDIQIFCRKIILGEYGELYENVSVPKLMSWLEEYVNERVRFIADYKNRIQNKKKREAESEVNPEGLKRMAKTFGEAHRKHLKRMAEKPRAYMSMQEYIDRNDLDPKEFWQDIGVLFESWCKDIESSSDSGQKIKDQQPEVIAAYKRMFTIKWLSGQNKLLNENFNKSNNAKQNH